MSFVNDFLEFFKVDQIFDKILIMDVLGIGVMITGKFEILDLSEEFIELKVKKEKLTLTGENLQIKSLSKGEIFLSGNILKTERGQL